MADSCSMHWSILAKFSVAGLDALAPHIELKTIQNNRGLFEHNAACLLTIKVQALVQGQAKQW